ncbi:plasmid transfer protein TraA [Kitasatospora sp. NPDC087861]|uniref:plasmid transfer protein TraA n=1 Tax=Kitasatospora sp. NPDC087861 TaxID=3364070 RepID=UPI003828B48C
MVNTSKNATAGFDAYAPGFAAKFEPTLNVNVGGGQPQAPAGNGQPQNAPHFILGEPVFDSTEDVRIYCNSVRAAMTQMAIELAIAGKILEARLSQARRLPGDHIGAARLRARRVAGKLLRTADAMTNGAKNAVAAHAALQREYSDLIQPRPQRQATTSPFKF